ncbi:hypothetical protein [Arenibacter latericius]|uniref:hypothetical protein n=1 Tax=Arenibacter latericius TaxID=86104 RepID=UPI0003FEC286|nr:hypothetical protein [Arenibacter latericius]
MIERNNVDKLFSQLHGKFDLEEPQNGHRERFINKLQKSSPKSPLSKNKATWWKPLSIAASIILLFSLAYILSNNNPTVEQQVSRISSEITNTQNYFAGLIEEQVKQLQNENSPLTEKIIADAMMQLRTLENDYKKMEQDLLNGGNSKLILSAMIGNFQTRIDLLNEILQQIEEIKTLKDHKDENNIT